MKLLIVPALLMLTTMPAWAVDLGNIQPRTGPNGPIRKDHKVAPGDILFFSPDIVSLAVDPKTDTVSYITTLQLLDAKGKVLSSQEIDKQVADNPKGISDKLKVLINANLAPGNYSVRYTVLDRNGKQAKAFEYMIIVK